MPRPLFFLVHEVATLLVSNPFHQPLDRYRATAVASAMAPIALGLCRLLLGDRSLNVPDLGFQLRTELRDQALNAPIRPAI